MSTRLRHHDLWKRMTAIARKATRAHVAVAYIGSGGHSRLRLPKRSVLVTALTEENVKNATTNPYEIEKFLKAGVEVFSNQHLHAKVYVLDDVVFLGSMNLSDNSARLDEVAVEMTGSRMIRSARSLVMQLRDQPVLQEHLDALKPLYGINRKSRRQTNLPRSIDGHVTPIDPVWLVPLVRMKWPKAVREAEKDGKAEAVELLVSPETHRIVSFYWSGKRELKRWSPGTRIVEGIKGRNGVVLVSNPCQVVSVKSATDGEGSVVFLARRNGIRAKRLQLIRKRLRRLAAPLSKLHRGDSKPILCKDARLIRALDAMWRSAS